MSFLRGFFVCALLASLAACGSDRPAPMAMDAGAADVGVDARMPDWPEPWDFHPALGDPNGIPADVRPLFVSTDVPPLPEPGPDDWLTSNPEPGQTFDQWLASSPNQVTEWRYILFVVPLGDPESFTAPNLDELAAFYEAFFGLEVRFLDAIDPVAEGITERRNPYDGRRQLLSTDVLALLRSRLPDGAFSLIAITTIDLYPEDSWNFVFGQASLARRVGVFSFARYGGVARETTMLRAFKVLAHETGHMFGIEHCTFFHCLMNGANHLAELDAEPIHLCPVDHRKLYTTVGFDPVARYRSLIEVYQGFGLTEEASWLENRLLRSGY